jgi:hypothetical protein
VRFSIMDKLKAALTIIVLTVLTWVGLNAGRTLYYDWAFLHQVRLFQEAHPPGSK